MNKFKKVALRVSSKTLISLNISGSEIFCVWVLKVIAGCLSEEEIQGLKEMFKAIDTDNSGSITMEELRQGLCKQGTKLSEYEVKQLMEAVSSLETPLSSSRVLLLRRFFFIVVTTSQPNNCGSLAGRCRRQRHHRLRRVHHGDYAPEQDGQRRASLHCFPVLRQRQQRVFRKFRSKKKRKRRVFGAEETDFQVHNDGRARASADRVRDAWREGYQGNHIGSRRRQRKSDDLSCIVQSRVWGNGQMRGWLWQDGRINYDEFVAMMRKGNPEANPKKRRDAFLWSSTSHACSVFSLMWGYLGFRHCGHLRGPDYLF